MSVKKAILPGADVPLVIGGGLMNPTWYAFFTDLMRRGVLDMPDVSAASITAGQFLAFNDATKKLSAQPETPPSNGQVVVWDAANKKWVPGSN